MSDSFSPTATGPAESDPAQASAPLRQQRVAAVVVAGGKGLRTGGAVPKQFVVWNGKPLLRHSLDALAEAGVGPLVVVIPADGTDAAQRAARDVPGVQFVQGGETRQLSVRAGLEALAQLQAQAQDAPDFVLIHDAARPGLTAAVIDRLCAALDKGVAAIPVLPVVDSLVLEKCSTGAGLLMDSPTPREGLHRVQTPQAFHFGEILAAHRSWTGAPDAGDDAQVVRAAGHEVLLVQGDEGLRKITFAEDFQEKSQNQTMLALPRTGTGFDVHRLVEGYGLWLCGVHIPHDKGLSGHSDADVAIHALVDALLGAIAAGDIGDHFPPSEARWKGARSALFLEHAAHLVREAGYGIAHVDVTIICEAPKIGPHKAAMREVLAGILGIDSGSVSVKATTTERLGFTGRGEGIAAQAVATVVPIAMLAGAKVQA